MDDNLRRRLRDRAHRRLGIERVGSNVTRARRLRGERRVIRADHRGDLVRGAEQLRD